MKVKYNKKIFNYSYGLKFTIDCDLIFNKAYVVKDIRRWSNGYLQYLIQDETGKNTWYSSKRFSNRREKLIEINKINDRY